METRKKILVVEDNALNRAMLVEILSARYTTLEAENGRTALELLRENPEGIALILLDVMMPVMDGYTFLDTVKQDPRLSLIPVIVLTQADSEDSEILALAHGAADFVPKPYRPQVILHRVAGIIHLRETAAMINHFQYDRLTGLYSKEFFFQKAQEILDRNPGRQYSILCSNIVNFKLYNDTFGIPAGDRMLKTIADGMTRHLGEEGIAGRCGDDRFVCLLDSARARYADLERMYRRTPGGLRGVEIKWGIYEITDRSLPVEYMCDRAMLAADSIRERYGCSVAVYDDVLRRKLLREQSITSSMESALESRQFAVYFQPKYRACDGRLSGAEALVRWNHPEWGFLSPGEFIPLFEKNGFIFRLDRFVWEQTCALLRQWQDMGYPVLPISVNVSRADIYQPDLAELLLELTKNYGIDPRLLHLEITESAYTENARQIIAAVEQLRARGFSVEMDDFGSGYSSLSMLSQLKLDMLKLDRTFVQNEASQDPDRGILRLMVEMAHRMGLGVVAEGVETPGQLQHLQEIGCDYVQGYLFSPPVSPEEFDVMLSRLSRQPEAPPVNAPKPVQSRQYLLVVEEEPHCRSLLLSAFSEIYQVIPAADCTQALSDLEGRELAAVIVSSTLPDAGARKIVSALRGSDVPRRIPILLLTPPEPETPNQELDVDDIACKPRDSLCLYCLRRRVEWIIARSAGQARERAMISEACRDYLTGLLNRRGLKRALDALGPEDYPLALYLFDLDDLKRANDCMGHSAGDRMLTHFADVLRRNTRSGDILCRYGGDEFAVILKGVRAADTVCARGDAICRGMAQLQLPDGPGLTCSGGAVLCADPDTAADILIEQADQALYQAKRRNKGTCLLWDKQA